MSKTPLSSRLADLLLRFPILWIGFIIIMTVFLGGFAGNVGQDYTLENMYPRSDEEFEYFRWFKEEFEPDDNIIMVGFESPHLWTDVSAWRDIETLTERFLAVEGVLEVLSLTSFEDLRGEEGDLILETLVDEFPENQADLAGLRERVLADSLLTHFLISPDGRVTAIYVDLSVQANTYEPRGAIISGLKAVTADFPQYQFHYSGIPYLRNQYVDLMQRENIRGNVTVFPLAIILLFLTFRSIRGIVLPLAVILMSIVWAVGWMGLFNVDFDMLTTIMPSILVVVGISDSIHLMFKYYEEREAGLDRKEALKATINTLGAATLMTSVTTAVGFAALATADIIPLKNFGVFTALGVLGAFCISIIFLTLMMTYLKPLKRRGGRRAGSEYALRWAQHAARSTRAHPMRILLVAAVVVVAFAWGIPRIVVDTHIMDDVNRDAQVIQDLEFFEREMSGVATLEFIIDGKQEGAAKTPELLGFADQLAQHLKIYPGIESIISPALMIKDLNQAMHDGDDAFHTIPDDRKMISQYLLLAMLSGKDPFENYISFDQSQCRVTARMQDVGSKKAGQLLADVNAYLAANTPAEYDIRITGTTKLIHRVAGQVSFDLGSSLALAFIIISILMGLLFKSPRWVIISLIPNVLPLVIIAGTMGWLGIRMRPTTAAVFSVAFGIAVDDTIHFLSRLRLELNRGLALLDAARNSLLHTGKAIIATSLLLMAGFGALLISNFTSSVEFGFLTCLTVFSALLADLYLLPVLVEKFCVWPGERVNKE
ncbi:MAG: MMPL family transporter [Fidelibacterota bacterium]|nr:MAG: MMPL family transporter [Candidatus Neomarinimicrobiota bacterium]